jgi:type IV secretory pathway VirD2 relaxase
VIQAIHKGIEIEMEIHQFKDGWKCDYTLIRHPRRDITIHHGDREFPAIELAREYALQEARAAIDKAG